MFAPGPSKMQVNPLFSSSSSSQQAVHIPTMEDIDVLLSPMDQQYQSGQRLELQQQEGGNFDRQVPVAAVRPTVNNCAGGQQGLLQGGRWPAPQLLVLQFMWPAVVGK